MYVPTYRGFGYGKAMLQPLAEHAENDSAVVYAWRRWITNGAMGTIEAWISAPADGFGKYKDYPLSAYYEKTIA